MKPDIENRLVVEVSKGLRLVKVNRDTSPKPDSFSWVTEIEKWLPTDVQRKCARFCGGRGFRTFLENEVRRKLVSARIPDADAKEKSLVKYVEFADTVSVAQDIVTVLAGLPYRYRVSVGLPLSLSKGILPLFETFSLSPSATLSSAAKLPSPFPLSSDNEAFNSTLWNEFWEEDSYDTTIQEDRVYLTITSVGYSGTTGTSLLARDFEDCLRAFYGAGLALKLFSYNYVKEEKEPPIIIHREDGDARHIITFKELEADLWSNKSSLGTKALSRGAAPSSDIDLALRRISQIYRDETSQKRLFTACIWYFRAQFTIRPLDKLLEATIAIEVILGDRESADGIGLTKLLGNRCAYMLGRTASERDSITQSFIELYKLRSSIVHSGKHRADQDETRIVNEAVRLCGRIIAHELRALEKEEDNGLS